MGKIRELDGLRGLLAVWVVVVHLLPTAGVDVSLFGFFSPLFGSLIRVKIFCILSGFVIFLMQDRRRECYWVFLRGRLLRLYPVYLVAFLGSVALAGLSLEALRTAPFPIERTEERIMALEAGQSQPVPHILAHLTLLHGVLPRTILPNAAYAFLGQAWNISTEFQFYLVAPFLFLGLTKGPLWRRSIFFSGCAVLWLTLHSWPNPADLAQYAPYFMLGIISFTFWRRDWSEQSLLNPLSVLTLGAASWFFLDMAAGIWLLTLGWITLVRDQGRSRWPVGWLTARPLLWLGKISYSLYLLHMIPLYLSMYLLNGLGLGQGTYLGLLALMTFALSLPLASVSAALLEQPFYRGRFAVPGSVVASGGGLSH